jgi:hypothetical protein
VRPPLHCYRALAFVVASIAVAALSVPNAAAEPMPQSIVVTSAVGPLSEEMEYRLQIQSGPEGAAFGVQYDLPSWPIAEPVLGSPVMVASVGVSGPGSIRPASGGPAPLPVLRRRSACVREKATLYSERFWVEVPANSVSVVVFRVRGTYPAWKGTKYGLSFFTFAVDDPFAQLVRLASVNAPRLMPKGTRISIRVNGQSRKGWTPGFFGRTFPPFRSGRLYLKVVRPSLSGNVRLEDWTDTEGISLGVVRTDRQGRFSAPPHRLEADGSFAVLARSEARGTRAADWNCGAFFSVD